MEESSLLDSSAEDSALLASAAEDSVRSLMDFPEEVSAAEVLSEEAEELSPEGVTTIQEDKSRDSTRTKARTVFLIVVTSEFHCFITAGMRPS